MRDWTNRVISFLAVVLAVWVMLVALLWLAQRQLIYLPDRSPVKAPPDVSTETVETSDGISHQVWLVPAGEEPLARVVVFNGNAGNMSHRLPLARSLADREMEVVLFDYRGYGDTDGSPSEEGLLRDAAAAAEVASDTHLPVVYFGESIGAGVATGLALERPPDVLVLRSPFPSLAAMARVHYRFVPTALLRDRFDAERGIATVDAPVLVILGTADSIVPPRLSRRVFEAANEAKELVELDGYNHNDPGLTSGIELATAVRRFVEQEG